MNNKLTKTLEMTEVYHDVKDTTFLTQIFPAPVNNFPLLDNSLPPITFVQKNDKHQITDTHQSVKLKKSSFSIVFPGLINNTFPNDFNVKVTASYDKEVFKKAKINQREEDTSIFGNITAFAMGSNNPFFIIDGDGHNVLYYDHTEHASLDYIKNINKDVLLLQFDIDKVHAENQEQNISRITKPIYMIIYMDKNLNKQIDEKEIFYVTINI